MRCLVVRSIYTGSLYKFLHSDGHHKDFETIDELMDKGFEFYVDPGIKYMTEHSKLFSRFEIKTKSNQLIDLVYFPGKLHSNLMNMK